MSLLLEGAEAADAILLDLYGLAPVAKAGPNPLLPKGFDALVLGMIREVKKKVDPVERRAVQAYLKLLDRDWSKLRPEDRERSFRQAAENLLGFGPDVGAEVGAVVRHVGPTIIQGTKEAAAHTDGLKIVPSFNAVDERMVRAAATHQALFVRDEYGRRSDALSARARAVVSKAMEDGLDREDIADRLRDELGAAFEARARSYWAVVASAFVGRARTFGHLSSLQEAGVEAYQIEAVLDEVTTEVCRFMHGKTFSTGAALSRFEAVETAADPEEVKTLQPWAGTGKAPDGGLALFYKTDAGRRMIARVDEPAAGSKDKVGRYSSAMSDAMLQKAGLSSPPFHGHCRTTVVPVFGSVSVPDGAPPPRPAPEAAKPKPPPRQRRPKPLPAEVQPAVAPPPPGGLDEEGVKDAAGKMAGGLDMLLKGKDGGPVVRGQTRSVVASYGAVSRDSGRALGNVLGVVPQRDMAGAVGDHDWTGEVRLAKTYAAQARIVTQKLAANPRAYADRQPFEVNAAGDPLRALFHEELHGTSRASQVSYQGIGVGIEEAATEILARKITRETLGFKLTGGTAQAVPFGLPVRDAYGDYRHTKNLGGAYNRWIEGLFNETSKVAGDDGIHERVEQAILRTRGGSVGDKEWSSGEEQIRAYVNELGLPKADGDRLYKALSGSASPLR